MNLEQKNKKIYAHTLQRVTIRFPFKFVITSNCNGYRYETNTLSHTICNTIFILYVHTNKLRLCVVPYYNFLLSILLVSTSFAVILSMVTESPIKSFVHILVTKINNYLEYCNKYKRTDRYNINFKIDTSKPLTQSKLISFRILISILILLVNGQHLIYVK